jgi:ParB/RepB/Spo0J family partition protein
LLFLASTNFFQKKTNSNITGDKKMRIYEQNEIEIAAQWEEISKLKEWEQNPRNNQNAIEAVAKSIKRFGFASPIIARKADNVIIAGHTRYKAALKLKLEKVPVRYLDIDPADAKLLALADNKIGEIADWNDDLLKSILEDLKNDEIDLNDIGFSQQELDNLLNENTNEEYIAPDNNELDLNDFDSFENKCPRCNFEWNENE